MALRVRTKIKGVLINQVICDILNLLVMADVAGITNLVIVNNSGIKLVEFNMEGDLIAGADIIMIFFIIMDATIANMA